MHGARWRGPGLVARLGAAVPEHVVDRGGRRGAVGGDEQLDGVQRAGADLDLLGGVVLEQLARRRCARRGRVRTRARRRGAGRGGRGCRRTASAGGGRASGARPASARSAAAICARLKNGTRAPVVARDVGEARPGREVLLEPVATRARERNAPPCSSRTRAPSSRRWRAKCPISTWPGSWPSAAATSSRPISASAARRPRPVRAQAGLDRAKAGHARALAQRREPARAEVDRVELERERGAGLVAGAGQVGRGRRYGAGASRVRLDRLRADADAGRRAGDHRRRGPDLVGQSAIRRRQTTTAALP